MRSFVAVVGLGVFANLVSCHSEIEHAEGEASFVTASAHDVATDALVAKLDVERMKSELTTLVGFGTRNSTSPEFVKALSFCEGVLAPLGYTTQRQAVHVGSKQTWNLVWERPGTGDGVVLLTAHLDSINQIGGTAAPGADDNGSGSVGTLEIARILATESPKKTVRFILWSGEEEGLYGSEQYVAALPQAEQSKITAIVNMDMIATRDGTGAPGVLLEGGTVSQRVIDGLASAAATYTTLAVKTSLHPYNSDHVPFIDAGMPAVLTIEGNDSQNFNMHTPKDTLGTIDYDLMKSILTMNLAFLATESGVVTSTSKAHPVTTAVDNGPGDVSAR